MADINIAKAPPNSAVLPFYATGAIAFFVLCLLIFLSPESLTTHYFNPHLLTIVHTAALGWGTMIIFGAAHQLLPVICEQDLFSNGLASASWFALVPGVAFLAFSFWDFNFPILMITGGSLIVVAVIMYVVNVVLTSRVCKRYSIQKLFVTSSAIWLLFTATVGLLLAINLVQPFFSKNHLDILKLHAHAGLAGWFLQLIVGVSSKLVPMFLLGKANNEKLLRLSFVLQNAGLALFLADGYFLGGYGRGWIYGMIVTAGIITWLRFLYDAYKTRVRKKIDIMMRHTFVSMLCVLISLLLIPVIYFVQGTTISLLYGCLVFMGWITSIILGMTFKTLPFIVWNGHYKNLSGKVKVPLPKHLYKEKLVEWQFWLFVAALIVTSIGILLSHAMIIHLGAAIWLVVAAMYLYNVVKILRHKTITF